MPKKKILTAILLGLLLIVIAFGYSYLFNSLTKSDIDVTNYEFSIVADSYDNTGIDLDSGFIITSKEDYSLDDVKNVIKVSPDFDYDISKSGHGRYYLKSESDLSTNSIYNIYAQVDGNMPINSWAFQTKASFKVLSTLPMNGAEAVALNSGIQIDFSKKVEAIDNFFEISPKVSGTFKYIGKSVTFIPAQSFIDNENYTITLKTGLSAIDGDKLTEDYTFSFLAKENEYFSQKIFLRTKKQNFTTKDSQMIALKYGKNNFSGQEFFVNVFDLGSYENYLRLSEIDDIVDCSKYELIKAFMSDLKYEDKGYDNNAFIFYPENLSVGWYLVDISTEEGSGNNNNQHLQQFVQVSDIVVFSQSLNGEALIWCNDAETGLPLVNANVKIGAKSIKTNENGVAIFDANAKNDVVISSENGKFFADNINFDEDFEKEKFKVYLYTDREAYKPTDTINYWGMIVAQESSYKLPKTIDLNLGYQLVGNDIDVNSSGVFMGSFDIKNHVSLYDELIVKFEEKEYYAKYISIEDYIKPTYILDFDFDKEVYRRNDVANIEINASYFDGNPASKLDLNLTIENDTESIQLDSMGTESIQYGVNNINRMTWYPTYVYANLHTSGADEDAEVGKSFIYCPTDYAISAEIVNNEMIIKSNLIDFNKINSNNFYSDDILGAPCGDISGEINVYRIDYIKTQVGSYYDFINKVNKPKYDYSTNKVFIEKFNFITDTNGSYKMSFDYPALEDSYYMAEISYLMPDGFSGEDSISQRYYNYDSTNEYYCFDIDKSSFKTNEEILVKIDGSIGFENKGKVLYAVLNDELKEVAITSNSEFMLKYKDDYIPNVLLTGAYFDGSNIHAIHYRNLFYDYTERELTLDITTDKESYNPGDTVKLNVEAKDKNGKAEKTSMVISVVDEAAFAVVDQYEDPLYSLYESNEYYPVMYLSSDLDFYDFAGGEGGGDGESGSYREYFKDTAAFLTIKTGSNGKTSASFVLPDNTTSWRITVVGITDSLRAGTAKSNIISTLPFYTNIVMNEKYNIDDDITFSLKSAGENLSLLSSSIKYTVNLIKDDEIVNSEVTYQLPFKSINVNMGKVLEAGNYKVEVKSECGVYKDTLVKEFTVKKSLLEVDIVRDVTLMGKLDVEALRYPVTFVAYDVNNKQYYDVIHKVLQTSSGVTAEQKLAHNVVVQKLNELNENNNFGQIEIKDMQSYNGGVKLLNYADSDVLLTAKVCALLPEKLDVFAAEQYFSNIINSEESVETEITAAYLGLAALKKPVLNDINYLLVNSSDMSLQSKLNLITGLAYIGDRESANDWYQKLIKTRMKDYEDGLYIYSHDEYESYSATSFLTMLLAKLDSQDLNKVINYILNKDFDNYTPALDLVEYINSYNLLSKSTGYIKYLLDDEEHVINFADYNNWSYQFDENKLKKFEILESVNANGKLFYTGTIGESKNLYDNNIEISKNISGGNKVGDFRTVTLKIKLSPELRNEEQIAINDIVPSGMRFVGVSDSYSYTVDGQKLEFTIFPSYDKKNEYVLQYSIRNVLQGEYIVESAIAINPSSNSMGYSKEERVVIE